MTVQHSLNPDKVSRAEKLVKARNRKNENKVYRYHADSELIKRLHPDSSALNPDEVSRAKELKKARNQKKQNQVSRQHAQCARKGLGRKMDM